MAAIDLTSTNSYPRTYTQASVSTTWQEFTLPHACTKVTIEGEGAAIYVAWDADGAVDGGAVGTHRKKWAADTTAQYFRRGRPHVQASDSVFVAAQAGTVTVTLIVESD